MYPGHSRHFSTGQPMIGDPHLANSYPSFGQHHGGFVNRHTGVHAPGSIVHGAGAPGTIIHAGRGPIAHGPPGAMPHAPLAHDAHAYDSLARGPIAHGAYASGP